MWLGKILMAFAVELENFEAAITLLRNENIPGLSYNLLPEWETDLGLPDVCSGAATTLAERQQVAHEKYTGKYTGMSKQFYIDYAAGLGFTITVADNPGGSPFRVDKSRFDRTPLNGVDGARFASVGVLHKVSITIVGHSDTVSDQYLMCRFNQLKPAHVEIIWI